MYKRTKGPGEDQDAAAQMSSTETPLSRAVKAHSTRSVAASTALLKGVSVEDICAAASWSSPGPFVRFYMLDMSRGSLGNSVLESGTPFTA